MLYHRLRGIDVSVPRGLPNFQAVQLSLQRIGKKHTYLSSA